MLMRSWRELLQEEMQKHGETLYDGYVTTLTPEQMDAKLDSRFVGFAGEAFTLWTKNRVYFPARHGGDEWVESVSRNPDGIPTQHIGL